MMKDLQARMKELEIAAFYEDPSDPNLSGPNNIAYNSRLDLCELVRNVWQVLDHAAISLKGYEQTGP